VPLALSLSVLTFLAAFVPIIGATVAGAAAALVTLVTNGPADALIVLVAVVIVQQLEGNLLQPIVMRRAVRLHPVVTLLAVTAGTLLAGIAGALIAVPACAVAYHAVLGYRGANGAQPNDTRSGPGEGRDQESPDAASPEDGPGEDPGRDPYCGFVTVR
jgi:predicted PurR-regulated permease PerM